MSKNGLPPIFQHTIKDIADAEILTSFPPNTFLENIAIDDAGDLYITSLEEGAVYHIDTKGGKELFATTKGQLTGILYLGNRQFLLNGWDQQGIPTLYLLNEALQVIPLHQPQGAQFLNGMVALNDHIFLVCDAYKGCIWQYDLQENRSRVWLEHHLLSRRDPESKMPAANGIKISKDAVFISNTDKQILVKVLLTGHEPGEPELFMDKMHLDDFAIDPGGNIYGTTHAYNSVVKITQQKEVTIIGEAEQGLAGSTAAAFGKREDDKNYIYVTTNGGMSFPLPGGIQEGRVVKIKVR